MIKKHQTLRYIYYRIKQILFEKKQPDCPWMTKESIKLLDQLINPTDVGVEYGSGRSTFWFAKRCKYLTSIESNKKWYDIVSEKIAKLNNVEYFLLDLNSTPLNSQYYRSIDKFKDNTIDFIIIDGKYREILALEAIRKVKKGGLIIFDNAERYLANKIDVPQSIGKDNAKVSKNMKTFVENTKFWRTIWTTDGVSTTLLMFKS